VSASPRWRRLPPAAFAALVTAWRTVLMVVVLSVGLAACTGPGGSASTNNDAGCAAVLPLARDTVHGQGTLTLIRRINGADADTITREAGVVPPAPPPGPRPPKPPPPNPVDGPPLPKTCLVVYQGAYPPGAITGASAPATAGHYALVVLRVRHPSIDRILITNTLPADTTPRPWWQRIF